MTTWIAYVKSGHEIDITAALNAAGITARCAKKAKMLRAGKNRRPDLCIIPTLPNYIFVTCDEDQYLTVVGMKYVASTMVAVPLGADCKMVERFLEAADKELSDTVARIAAGERVDQFKPGQALKIIDGPFSGFLANYRGIVETLDPLFPELKADIEMMGRVVPTKVDPLHVRAAE